MKLELPTRQLDLATPQVMGVLNLTPDSFSDGGRYLGIEAALTQALRMIGEGAAIVDIGGESTRPGAVSVSEQEELDRVIGVIQRLRAESEVVISIDTRKPAVMAAACAAGAELVNDVNALRAEGALAVVARSGAAVCLMHMQGEPGTMQQAPSYTDVTAAVAQFLRERVEACTVAGIPHARLCVDPGFGFGKALAHNLRLMATLSALTLPDLPLVIGVSRKSMLGQVTGTPVAQRLPASLAAAALAVWQGARIIRAHDVAETVAAVRFAAAVAESR